MSRVRGVPSRISGSSKAPGVDYSATPPDRFDPARSWNFMEEAQLGDDDEIIVVVGSIRAVRPRYFWCRQRDRFICSSDLTIVSASMSRDRIRRRIEETPIIQLRTRTEIVALEGNGHLERVQWRDGMGGVTSHDVRHVFLMTGAEANTT
jgi:thioredoxin reductase (NADPH)